MHVSQQPLVTNLGLIFCLASSSALLRCSDVIMTIEVISFPISLSFRSFSSQRALSCRLISVASECSCRHQSWYPLQYYQTYHLSNLPSSNSSSSFPAFLLTQLYALSISISASDSLFQKTQINKSTKQKSVTQKCQS